MSRWASDRATDGRMIKPSLTQRPNGGGYPISVLESEIRVPRREGRNLAARSKNSEGLLCDILNVHLPRRPQPMWKPICTVL